MHKEKIYIIISTKDFDKVNWSHVHQSIQTVRKSKDGKAILSYWSDSEQPQFVYSITGDLVGFEEYTVDEILSMISSSDNW